VALSIKQQAVQQIGQISRRHVAVFQNDMPRTQRAQRTRQDISNIPERFKPSSQAITLCRDYIFRRAFPLTIITADAN
jgi:hypothetical protein